MGKRDHHYFVYIIASRTRVLYTGMTNSVARRTEQHREAAIPGFTADYQCHRLVFFEHYQYVHNAIAREKQIKRWSRAKKIELIERTNPSWADLSEAWRRETADLSTALRSVEKHCLGSPDWGCPISRPLFGEMWEFNRCSSGDLKVST